MKAAFKDIQKSESTRDLFKQLYKEPKVFRNTDYAPRKEMFTVARKELAAYAFLCRQQEAREWIEQVLNETFPLNPDPKPDDPEIYQRSYKSDLFPALRDGMRLCRLINIIKKDSIKFKDSTGKPFVMLENINFFLEACKSMNIPDHKLFLPLDLHERKNMPRVVYCLHSFAIYVYEKYGIGLKIVDKTGKFNFTEDELAKAQRDLDEVEEEGTAVPKRSHSELEREREKVLLEQIRKHNEDQIFSARRFIHLNQLTPTDIVIVGSSKAEEVSGEPDENYALAVDITFNDGSKATEFISFSTGSHEWEQKAIAFSPGDKCIKEVSVYPRFFGHEGKVWFDGFGCFEDQRPTTLIQFVQNPSFEEPDGNNKEAAAFWSKNGSGYVRNSDEHCLNGTWSIVMNHETKGSSSAQNHVNIYQGTPAPLFIEGWSKAENVEGETGKGYSIHANITFSDNTKTEEFIPFSVGTHEWEKVALIFDPKTKTVKEIDIFCKFEGYTGKVYFDHVTVCQEEFKQYVLNPSFESKDPKNGLAAHWEPEGNGYTKNFNEYTQYGHTSIEMKNSSESEFSTAKQVVVLDQKQPNKVLVQGFSKAHDVSGEPDLNYALFADVKFKDGSEKKGLFAAFSTGTHDWEEKEFSLDEDKPIQQITLWAQFRKHTGHVLFDNLTISEEYLFDESQLFMMQAILKEAFHSQREDKNWSDEITELKKRMLVELRKNHQLEKQLSAIENKIALLIKNRIDVQEVLQARKRFLKIFRIRDKKQTSTQKDCVTIETIKKNVVKYQHLFYLLQTEPKYLAKIVYLISMGQLESFLETVILTLFGDVYSPREEYLLLQLLQAALEQEIGTYKDIGGFLESNTVIAKMIVAYNRREQGQEYLVKTLAPVLQRFIQVKDLELEISPLKVLNSILAEEETRSGKKSSIKRPTTDEEALRNDEVKKIIANRTEQLEEICSWFFDAIVNSMKQLPFGLRWICKQIVDICNKNFKTTSPEQVQKVISYFVYYRFFNPAIVSPDLFNVVRLNLNNLQRKNLVQVSKVLQTMFNFSTTGTKADAFIQKNTDKLKNYLNELIKVPEAADFLMVDQYIELTSGTKPIVLMTYSEVYSTHEIIVNNLNLIAPDQNDPLRIIVKDLGALPEHDLVDDDLDREIQLTLINRFSEQVETKVLKEDEKELPLIIKIRDLFIELMTELPLHTASSTLLDLMEYAKQFIEKEAKVKDLAAKINQLMQQFLNETKQDKQKGYEQVMEEIKAYVDNQAAVRIQKRNILKRLRLGLENLLKSQQFMNEQVESFNVYLKTAIENQQIKKKGKKQKDKVAKFSYQKLLKQGVIVKSSVPENARKGTSFTIWKGDDPNEYHVKAKVAGITTGTVTLKLDDLLEKQSQGIENLDLENVTLNVNLTVHMINKTFLQK